MPQVALSGEGLDEITFRHEAFAQRHVWGLDHSEGTWNRSYLATAHPISSYILTPHTTLNGYLGMCNPGSDQLYAAWREAYQHWWVIPTFANPSREQLEHPSGFAAQLIAEAQAFQQHELTPDPDGDWPADVLASYRGKNGVRARYRRQGGTVFEIADAAGKTTEISRTITGVSEIELPGTIPGWQAYDARRLFSLDPDNWYPYLPQPRDLSAGHVESVPQGMAVGAVRIGEQIASVTIADRERTPFDFARALSQATTGAQIFDQQPMETRGPLESPTGAHFAAIGDVIHAHPPWKGEFTDPDTGEKRAGGTGVAYALYQLGLPVAEKVMFRSQVYLDPGAIGPNKSDGVTFSVEFRGDGQVIKQELHQTSSEPAPLDADLTPLAGKRVQARLQVHPGPKRDISFDWARWRGPRIEADRSRRGAAAVVAPYSYERALAGSGPAQLTRDGHRLQVEALFPATFYLLARPAERVALPVDLAKPSAMIAFVSHTGAVLQAPQYADFAPAPGTCGGVPKNGISAHPPDRGATIGTFVLRLPPQPAKLTGFVGLRDGSKSEGVRFLVEVNGRELFRHDALPSKWEPFEVDLAPFAGQEIVLALTTDSITSHYFDWACWGEPMIVAR
jgi:hypothetical protein